MKIDKKLFKLGMASLALLASPKAKNKRKKSKEETTFKIDDKTEWVLNCLDDMVMDMKQVEKQQDIQEKRMAHLEKRIDNVNSRLDNILDGKQND